MQLHITFSVSSCPLPVNYRPLVHGMIYRVLSADAALSEQLHNYNAESGTGRPFKGFTFSQLRGQYTVDGHTIWFSRQIGLEIRGWHEELMEAMHRYFSRRDSVQLGTETLRVSDCRLTDAHLHTESAVIRMASPAVAYMTDKTNHTVFFSPDQEQFYASLAANAQKKGRLYLADAPCDLRVLSMNNGLPRKQFSMFKKTYITAWYGTYRLEGDPRLIDLLYQVGLGAKNSEGYGLFQVVDS